MSAQIMTQNSFFKELSKSYLPPKSPLGTKKVYDVKK